MRVFRWLTNAIQTIRDGLRRFNKNTRNRYNPARLALVTVGIICVLMTIMLFIPPYIGLSNDGSFDKTLGEIGLERVGNDDENVYFDYYERVYRITQGQRREGSAPGLLRFIINLAIQVDTLFTPDEYFDMRYLAFIYMVMYLFAVYPMIRAVLSRVKLYSEGIVIALLCVLVLADVSIVARFASLYTAPLEWILIISITDALLLTAQHEGRGPYPFMLAAFTSLLMLANAYCALAGMVFQAFYWVMVRLRVSFALKAVYTIIALVLCVQSTFAVMNLVQSQTPEQKYNQMTRGVLFQVYDPEKALATFGIEPRYSILSKTYADQEYRIVIASDGTLDEGFLDMYSTSDIIAYYASHPGALLGLFDLAVRDSFMTRQDYSGNYERDYGMAPRAKSLFMSIWSTFKSQSAPKTSAFALLLAVGLMMALRKRKNDRDDDSKEKVELRRSAAAILILFATINAITVVVMSGDSEIMRESFMIGGCIDIIIILLICETLRRLNIIGGE